MPIPLRHALLTTAALVAFTPLIAGATAPDPISLPRLASDAATVVHGRVLDTSSRWNADRSLIVTDVRVEVITALKGSPPPIVTVTQPGGTVGRLRVEVPGASAFQPDQETVLFLVTETDGALHVPGLSAGRFDVHVDRDTGMKYVPALPGLATASKPTPTGPQAHGAAPRPIPLDQFLDRVARLLDEPAELPR